MRVTSNPKLKVWITGASSGIGLALAKAYSQQGHTVFISSRNAIRLQDIANELMQSNQSPLGASNSPVIPVACDVCSEEDMNQAYITIQSHTPYLDKVFLNAGDCEYFSIQEPNWSMMKRMMEVNYFGAIRTLEAALPLLREKQNTTSNLPNASKENAHIVGISSLATNAAFPKAEAYGSSKAALRYFLDSLALDLHSEKIDITTVLPGFVKTPLTAKNNFSMPFLLDSDEAASRIIKGIAKRPRTVSFPKRLSSLLKLSHWFPNFWRKMVMEDTVTAQNIGRDQ
jgi:NAD(P)-dependent dehydrogenase (short-subunit alcohol dehydrogenase family)